MDDSGVAVAGDMGVQGFKDAILGTKVHTELEKIFIENYKPYGFKEVNVELGLRAECVYDNAELRIIESLIKRKYE